MTRRPTLRRGERLRWRHGPDYIRGALHAAASACYGNAAIFGPRGVASDVLALKAMLETSSALVALAPHFHRMGVR